MGNHFEWYVVETNGGLHLRIAMRLVDYFVRYWDVDVWFYNWNGDRAKPDSMISLMLLNIKKDEKIGLHFPDGITEEMRKDMVEMLTESEGDGTAINPEDWTTEREMAIEHGSFIPIK